MRPSPPEKPKGGMSKAARARLREEGAEPLVCPELVVVLPAERCVAVAASPGLADVLTE